MNIMEEMKRSVAEFIYAFLQIDLSRVQTKNTV